MRLGRTYPSGAAQTATTAPRPADRAVARIVGSGRIVFEAGAKSCELGMSVTDSWQRRGVGRRLLETLIETARDKGHTQMWARVLATNQAMTAFLLRRGFVVSNHGDGTALKIARLAL